ncbi:MAG: DUF998 domain-containing protein [Leucobacter sp.]
MTESPPTVREAPKPAIEREPSARTESRASYWAIAAFLFTAAVYLIWVQGAHLPLAGDFDSLGTIAAWITGVCTAAAFAVAFVIAVRHGRLGWRRELPIPKRIVDGVALTVAFAAVSALSVEAIANIFQRGFQGLTVDPLGGAALAGAAAAVFAYAGSLLGARTTTVSIAMLATLVLFIGTMASMLTSPDDRWWELHFSQLGNQSGSGSAIAFNGALILTGLVIVAFADYAARDAAHGLALRRIDDGRFWSTRRRARTISWLLIAIGALMCVVGLVHDEVNTVVHVGAASGMVVVFGLLAVFTLSVAPELPRSFAALTAIVLAGIIASAVLWVPVGYLNLTGVEFVSAGLLFTWFVVYARTISAYALGPTVETERSGR